MAVDPVVQFDKVSYVYPTGRFSLQDISFEVHKGEIFAFTGTNGAGKTTLLRLIVGLLTPQKGNVRILDMDLVKNNFPQIRTKVGFVFQNPDEQLFAATIYEDVAFGPRNLGWSDEQVDEAVNKWLGIMGLPDYGDYSPYELSYGQKKRAALAGVFTMNPEIILLDEPFAYLDLPSTFALIRLINRIVAEQNVTVIFSSHDYDLVKNWSTNMLALNGGRKIFLGKSKTGFKTEKIKEILGDPDEFKNIAWKPKIP